MTSAVEFMLAHLQRQTAVRKVLEAVAANELAIPSACEHCLAMERLTPVHQNGYDLLHQYDVVWLCTSCACSYLS